MKYLPLLLFIIAMPAQAERLAEADDEAVVATIDYDITRVYSGKQWFVGSTTFSPIDLSGRDSSLLYLSFEAEITERTPGDVNTLYITSGQVELTSSGKSNQNEINVQLYRVPWKTGTHAYRIPLGPSRRTGGDIDWSNINYLKFYLSPESYYDCELTIRIYNVRILDYSLTTWLPNHFSDGMLVQQEKPIPIHGFAPPGRDITVCLKKDGQTIDTQSVTSNEEGRWAVNLTELEGGYDTYQIEILDGDRLVQTIDDIVAGELWVASGQSNMALRVKDAAEAEQLLADMDDPYLRVLCQQEAIYQETVTFHPDRESFFSFWAKGDNASLISLTSAIGIVVCKQLRKQLNVPVGFVNAAVGSTAIENWLSFDAMASDPLILEALRNAGKWYTAETWTPAKTTRLGHCWNTKIAPLAGLPIAGVMWYQGESNYKFHTVYDLELKALVNSWEQHFGFETGCMPFVFCQICPFREATVPPCHTSIPAIDEHMLTAWRECEQGRMAMLPLYDLPATYSDTEIHPTQKMPVGQRMVHSILNLVYGGEEEYTAPVMSHIVAENNSMRVHFDHTGNGLTTTDGLTEVRGFTVAGDDGIHAPAQARIVSPDEVLVWNPAVKNPCRVTYAYSTYHKVSNLTNSSRIPAAPFRSDASAKNAVYFDQHAWIHADSTAYWGLDSQYVARFVEAWQVNPISLKNSPSPYIPPAGGQGALTFDTHTKTEGRAALCLSYSPPTGGQGGFSIGTGPILGYPSQGFPLAEFSSLFVDVLNPDAHPKQFSLLVENTNGEKLQATVNCHPVITLPPADDFVTVGFDLTRLIEIGETTATTDAPCQIKRLQFTAIDSQEGRVYLDNVSFGTSTPEVVSMPTSIAQPYLSPANGQDYPLRLAPNGVPTRSNGLIFRDGKKWSAR